LGFLQGTHPNADDLPPAIHINANRALDIGTDGGQPLSKLGGCNAISRQTLMIQPLKLLDLAGFKPL
jgi:hypothetical protein